MRIIAGQFRGRQIARPVDRTTRPMLDRVREAMFSTLGDLVPDARVLDLFAGTGSLGLEALSRGALSVRFIERERVASKLLKQNLESLDVGQAARALRGDALERSLWRTDGSSVMDLIFLDPPYPWLRDRKQRAALFGALVELVGDVLAPGGALVFHTHPRDVQEDDFQLDVTCEKRVYGNTALWYLWKPLEPEDESEGDEACS